MTWQERIISPDKNGYIKKSVLEDFLERRFGTKIKVKRINDRFVFKAPEDLTDDELGALAEKSRPMDESDDDNNNDVIG